MKEIKAEILIVGGGLTGLLTAQALCSLDLNIILVDSSYTSFYRFFATKVWYGLAHKEEYKEIKEQGEQSYNWLTNEIFMEKYALNW